MLNPNRIIANLVAHPVLESVTFVSARALMAYIFIVAGWDKIAGYEQRLVICKLWVFLLNYYL